MKKIAILVLAMVMLFALCSCNNTSPATASLEEKGNNSTNEQTSDKVETSKPEEKIEGDFRSASWGMSIEEVKQTESQPPDEAIGNALLYTGNKILDFSVATLYQFSDDKLVMGGYVFTQTHSEKLQYYQDYKKIAEAYKEKYGDPTLENANWLNDLYKSDPKDWGRAIAAGHVTFQTVWKTQNTIIIVATTGDNYKITLGVNYTDINYEAGTNMSGI